MGAVLLNPEVRWGCPACTTTAVTREARPHTEMHSCPGMKNLTVPMVRFDGVELRKHAAVHRLAYREDYIGDELVQRDPDTGAPLLSVVTEHADGHTDCTVYPGTAVGLSAA
jgi:hypothetical protein